MTNKIEVLRRLIAEFFKDEFYHIGIANVRKAVRKSRYYKDDWDDLIKLILFKELPYGEALNILDKDGNLILHENSEEEAYRWLTLMIINVSRGYAEPILDDREFLDPEHDFEIRL